MQICNNSLISHAESEIMPTPVNNKMQEAYEFKDALVIVNYFWVLLTWRQHFREDTGRDHFI